MEDFFDENYRFGQYLSAGEYIKWTGRSEKKAEFQPIYLFLIPFMMVWCGGVIFATVGEIIGVIGGEAEPFGLVFLIPFWAGGCFFVYSLFIAPYLLRKHTVYAVTNRKVIAKYKGRVKMINLDPMPLVQMSVIDKRGCGSITVGGTYNTADYANAFPTSVWQNQGSIVISNVKDPAKVYEAIVRRDA